MNVRSIVKFHQTRPGYMAFGLVELGLFLWLVNLAIPSGDWWEWLLAFICLLGFLQNMGRMIVGAKK